MLISMSRTRTTAWIAMTTALSVACASTPPFRAEPLAGYLPGDLTLAAEEGVRIAACRLTATSVARVLGPRSEAVAANAAVFQVQITTSESAVEILPESFRLELPSGETIRPMSSALVAAAVSGRTTSVGAIHGRGSSGSGSSKARSSGKEGSRTEPLDTSEATSTADAVSKVAIWTLLLGVGVVALAVQKSTDANHWNALQVDVEGKTSLPRDIAPGESIQLLVVFWPQMGGVPNGSTLTSALDLKRDGRTCREELHLREP